MRHPGIAAACTACLAFGQVPAATTPDAPHPVHALDDFAFLDENQWVETVSRRRQPIALAPQAVTVLDAADLALTPAVTVPDRLRYLPGVDVYQNRHGQFDVGLRGFNGIATPRTLALYDGREFASEELGAVFWIGPLHPSDIRRVEVVKGPASVTYGADAFGGVIALRSHRAHAARDAWQVHGYSGLGDHGRRDVDATALGPLPGWRSAYLKVSAGHSARDDFPGNRGLTPDDPPHPRSRQTGATDLRSDRFRAVLGVHLAEDARLEVDYRYLDLGPWDSIEDLSSGSNLITVDEWATGVTLTLPWAEVEYVHTENDGFYSNQVGTYVAFKDFRYAQAGFDNTHDRLRLQSDLHAGDHTVTLGAEFERFRSESNLWARRASYADRSTWRRMTIRNRAVYAEHQWDIDGAWSTTAGLRVDDHNMVGDNLSPRVALNRRFGTDHFARLSFSSGYRLPTAIELGIEEFFFRVDDDLEAESIQSLDLSWQGKVADLDLNAGAFYNRTDGLFWFHPLSADAMRDAWLDFLAEGDPTVQPGPFFALENLDTPNQGFGLEVGADWRLGDHWSLWGNGTWQRYRFDERIHFQSDGFIDPISGDRQFQFDERFPRDVNAPPSWTLNTGVRYRVGALFATAVVRYVDERLVFSFPNSELQNSGDLAVEEVPAHAAFDLALGWVREHDDGRVSSIRLAIMNLFDNRHHETHEVTRPDLLRDDEVQFSSEVGRRVALLGDIKF